jgi:hypothetical protein
MVHVALLVVVLIMVAGALWVFTGAGKRDPVALGEVAGRCPAGAKPTAGSVPACAARPAIGDAASGTTTGDAAGAERCAAEAALVRELLRGALGRTDYHDAMAGLAATDAVRNPMGVPPAS